MDNKIYHPDCSRKGEESRVAQANDNGETVYKESWTFDENDQLKDLSEFSFHWYSRRISVKFGPDSLFRSLSRVGTSRRFES